MTTAPTKKSDLGVRTLSAIAMLAVAGTALWLGGWWWTVFVAAVALGVLWEWWGLVSRFEPSVVKRGVWRFCGIVYIGLAAFILVFLRSPLFGVWPAFVVIGAVVAIDIGAYFAGRTFRGPKIASKISPSKTWSGLFGGCLAAVLVIAAYMFVVYRHALATYNLQKFGFIGAPLPPNWLEALIGIPIAIIAQAGDFFESWMKRRAGVKDSSNLIPGHGGLFDRVDGLLAVCFAGAMVLVVLFLTTGIH